MLMNRTDSTLLVIDMQERLTPAIHGIDAITANCAWLARLAGRLEVPVVVSEHVPDKLGHTLAALRTVTPGAHYLTKQCFSVQGDGRLADTAVKDRLQVILCGIEAHVCVLQTAIDLATAGKAVYVVADACGSRDPADRDLAYARARACGIEVVSREMVAFEWLERAGTDLFREINRDFIR